MKYSVENEVASFFYDAVIHFHNGSYENGGQVKRTEHEWV